MGTQLIDSAALCYTIVNSRETTDSVLLSKVIKAKINLGYLYAFCYFNYEKAYTYTTEALRLCKKQNNRTSLPYAYLNLADIFYIYNLTLSRNAPVKQILALYQQAIDAAVAVADWRVLMPAMSSMISMAFVYNALPDIKHTLTRFMQLKVPQRTPMFEFTRCYCMAALQSLAGNSGKALQLLDKAAQSSNIDPESRQRVVWVSAQTSAIILQQEGHLEEAAQRLIPLLPQLKVYKAYDVSAEVNYELYKIALQSGNEKEADQYYIHYLKAKERLLVQGDMNGVGRLQFQQQLSSMQSQLQNTYYHQQKLLILLIGTLICVAIVVTFSVMLFRTNRRLNMKNRRLYKLIKQTSITEPEKNKYNSRYVNSTLSAQEKQLLEERIQNIMNDTAAICKNEFSLHTLAEQVQSNYKNVSQVINEQFGMNFNQLLAQYRVREACRMIDNETAKNRLSLSGVAASVGYKSHASFVAAFKSVTGMLPSEYQKIAKEK